MLLHARCRALARRLGLADASRQRWRLYGRVPSDLCRRRERASNNTCTLLQPRRVGRRLRGLLERGQPELLGRLLGRGQLLDLDMLVVAELRRVLLGLRNALLLQRRRCRRWVRGGQRTARGRSTGWLGLSGG